MYLAEQLETWMMKGRSRGNGEFNRPSSERNLPERQQDSGCCLFPVNLQDRCTGSLSQLTNPHTAREPLVPFMEPFSRTCLGVVLPLLSLSSVPGGFFFFFCKGMGWSFCLRKIHFKNSSKFLCKDTKLPEGLS